ncbi:Uncharacterised protein [Mycobacteroides abscessus subsp. abscessus]|nr:Uncharacterised protein [Mycobacteroides abscessus subsp. abscessus]SLG08510.1 Uncharacterised protein [Mycobacteroides abscessus subsp. abscessus]
MTWSPHPNIPPRTSGGKWSPNPAVPTVKPTGIWHWVPRVIAADTGVSEDSATLTAHLMLTDNAIGFGNADVAAHLFGHEDGLGSDQATMLAHLTGTDTSVADGVGTGMLKYYTTGTDTGIGYGSASLIAHLLGMDTGLGHGGAATFAHLTGFDSGIGYGGSSAAFSPHAPDSQQFISSGTYAIPAWCYKIDVILIGAGGGGGNGSLFLPGNGGDGGAWQIVTLVRGVDIPWSASAITVTIGLGGVGGIASGGANNGQPGGSTVINCGAYTLSAIGGSGGIGWGNLSRNGKTPSPASQTLNGQTYNAGAGGTGAGAAPGAGGASQQGTVIGNRPGFDGARGQAWFYAYQ